MRFASIDADAFCRMRNEYSFLTEQSFFSGITQGNQLYTIRYLEEINDDTYSAAENVRTAGQFAAA